MTKCESAQHVARRPTFAASIFRLADTRPGPGIRRREAPVGARSPRPAAWPGQGPPLGYFPTERRRGAGVSNRANDGRHLRRDARRPAQTHQRGGSSMKALVWHARRKTSAATPFPIRGSRIRATPSSRSRARAICGSDLHLFDGFMPGMESGDVMGHEPMGEVVEVGAEAEGQAEGRRPDRRSVHDHLRRVRPVQARQLLGLRDDQPQQVDRGQGVRPHHRRPVRLHPPDRRLPGRSGRVPAGAVRGCDPHQGAATASPTRRSCSSATSCRPAGRRRCSATSSRTTRWRSGAAARSGR